MKDERFKKIVIDEFDYTVLVVLCKDVNESRARRNRMFDAKWQSSPCTLAITDIPSDGSSVVFLNHKPAASTIAHESFHVVWNLYQHIGAKMEEEITAYLIGYLVEKITDFVKQ